jgi:hypothetical protein
MRAYEERVEVFFRRVGRMVGRAMVREAMRLAMKRAFQIAADTIFVKIPFEHGLYCVSCNMPGCDHSGAAMARCSRFAELADR